MIQDDRPDNATALNEMQQELETSRQVLKAIFDSFQSSIFMVATDFRIVFFNKWARDGSKLLYSRDLFIGDSILNYRREGDEEIFKSFKENFEQALLTKSQVISEREMHPPEMSLWLRSEYTPVYEQDKPIGVMLHVQNISDRKKFENKSERQSSQLNRIAWSQSHETRQPVATLLGLLNIFRKNHFPPKTRRSLKLLEETAFKLEGVIRQNVILANIHMEENDVE